MKRRTDIDLMRGAAMVCVMLGHIFGTYLNNGSYKEYAQLSQGIFDVIYSFHMPFMFLISGYVEHMVSTRRKNKQSISRLMIVMMIPYMLFSYLSIIVNGVLGLQTINIMSFFKIFVEPISGLWFLYALFLFKVMELGIKRFHIHRWLVGLISLIAMIMASWGENLSGILFYVCAFGFSYFVGYILYNAKLHKTIYIIVTATLVIGEIVFYNWNEVLGKTIVGISLFILAEGLLKDRKLSVKPLEYIGSNCMVYYVIDGFTNSPVSTILWTIGITNYWVVSIITLIVKLLIPYIILQVGKHCDFIMGFFYPTKWKLVKKYGE